MKKNELLNDNKGFSLVELIVTVLITAILMTAVTMFVSTSRSAYQTVNTSATMQEEAMTAERIFTEVFMEAKEYGFETDVSLVSGSTTDVIWTKAKENEDSNTSDSIYCFVVDRTANQISYYKDLHDETHMTLGGSLTAEGKSKLASECFGTNAKYSMVCKNVKSVAIEKVPRSDGTDLICMKIIFEYIGKEYTENITVVTRNLTHAVTAEPATPAAEDPPEDG